MTTDTLDSGAGLDTDASLARGTEGMPFVRIEPRPGLGRARLAARYARHLIRSLRRGHLDFVLQAMRSSGRLATMTVADIALPRSRVECNICGWSGRRFYPNTGPGYDETDTTCAGCVCLSRQRSLVLLLCKSTDFFAASHRVIEVAPMRDFQAFCLRQPDLDYVSFDLERFAMERADLTNMHYPDGSADYFLCFHVLEHVPEEDQALAEIVRVLKPGGQLVMQVPVDWSLERTYEYNAPDPREVGHVRRYGRDLKQRLERYGLEVRSVSVADVASEATVRRHGLCREPIFFGRKTAEA